MVGYWRKSPEAVMVLKDVLRYLDGALFFTEKLVCCSSFIPYDSTIGGLSLHLKW